MDSDLDDFTREQLIAELVKLSNAMRVHRDSTGHAPVKNSRARVAPEYSIS